MASAHMLASASNMPCAQAMPNPMLILMPIAIPIDMPMPLPLAIDVFIKPIASVE